MRVVLTTPPIPKGSGFRPFYPSLGLLYLASYAEAYAGLDLELIYFEGSFYDEKEFVRRILKIDPDMIGLTFTTRDSNIAYDAINEIKRECKHVPVICGGPHTTAVPFDVLKKSRADVCVIGEGEVTFKELLEAYDKKRNLSSVNGIAVRKNGNILVTPKRCLIKDLDALPLPAWDKINFRNYGGYQLKKAWPDVCILSTRGCPYNCTFCSNPVWKQCKPWVRLRSPQNIAKEINYLVSCGAKEIYDFADEFNANLNWSVKVAEEISRMQSNVLFKVQLRADKITEGLAYALKKMGCWLAYVGIESGNQETLDGIGKKLSLRQVIKGLSLLKKYGIKTQGYFMIFNVWEENGQLKFETPKMVEKTLKFARALISGGLLDIISWSIATPMPGSQLYDISLRHRLINENFVSDIVGEKMLLKLPGLTKRDVSKVKFEGMLLQMYCGIFHGNVNWRNSLFLSQKTRILVQNGLEFLFPR